MGLIPHRLKGWCKKIGRKVKCRLTGETGSSDDFIKIDGKYYKNQQVYDAWNKENEGRKKVIEIIAFDFLGYRQGQVFPTVLTKKLKELEFYGYDVILKTVEKSRSAIEYSMNTKDFSSDIHKISYIMAIIKNNINDVYREFQRTEKIIEKQESKTKELGTINDEVMMSIGSKQKAKDISDFLEDDEWI